MDTLPFTLSPSIAELEIDVELGILPAGTIIGSRYRVVDKIGVGGMGVVYLGEHLSVGRKVAIKVLLSEWSRSPAVVARFEAEARTTSTIGHPGIVDVLDAGILPDGRLYLVMEYLAGRDLDLELAEHGPFDPLRACILVRAVASAIEAAHAAGVVHRDLKPENIVVTVRAGEEVVKVLDFGIAADRTRARFSVASTAPGTMIGTPEHMPPEQAIGDEVGPHFDIYALGSLLFTLLDGEPPFVEENALKLLARKQNEDAPSLADRVDGLPPALVELVADALAINVGERPASASEFIDRLDAVIDELDPATSASFRATRSARASLSTGAYPTAAASSSSARGKAYESLARTIVATPLEDGRAGARAQRIVVAVLIGLGLALIAWGLGDPPDSIDPAVAATTPRPADAADDDDDADDALAIPTPPPRTTIVRVEPATATTTTSAASEAAAATTEAATSSTGGDPPAAATSKATRGGKVVAAYLSPRCQQVREQTQVARDAYRWSTVLELAGQRRCWQQSADARKLETQARMETGDFAGCVAASTGLTDTEVTRWRALCRKRGGIE